MFFPLFVVLEDVESILRLDLIVKTKPMGDLIFLLHEIQLVFHRRVVFISIFAHLEQNFDHVLHPLVDIGLVQDIPELVKHCQCDGPAHFFQMLSHLSC